MATEPELDRQWMQRALELARRGLGLTSPNPAVGCVLLDARGELCGQGWHEYDRKAHAEIAALRDAAGRARNGTAYVTLEPCNHTGRTGPCSQALIDAGVRRVVAATIDPNAAVSGGGLARLRDAGVETVIGVCQEQARRLNEGFARWIQTRRPFVLMKVAMTLDGRIAPRPHPAGEPFQAAGKPIWITGEQARADVHRLRWQSDAIVTGIDTVLADNPLLTDRSGAHRRRPLLRVVLDSQLRLPPDCKLVESIRNDCRNESRSEFRNDLVVFTVSQDEARADRLRRRGVRVEVLPAENGHVPLDGVLETLGKEEILTLLTETGSRLNTALLTGGFVDRLQFFIAPQLMGSEAVPAFGGLDLPVRMEVMEMERVGDDLGLTALLRNPWPS